MGNKSKEINLNTEPKEKKLQEIPFGKPIQIGGLKMWRTKVMAGDKETIQAIVVSNLDQTWKVQIPETYMMFRAITDLYSTESQKDTEILFSFLSNFNLCTSISNGCFQNFLILAVYAYMHPEVLDDGYEPEDKKHLSYDEFMQRIQSCVEAYKSYAEEMKKDKGSEENEIGM